jgi:hypothetical protein
MRTIRMMLLSAALVAGCSVFAAAQYTGGTYQNGVYVGTQYGNNSDAYQRGVRDGQDDARHGRTTSTRHDRYHNDADRQAYDQGYAQGYQSAVNNNGGYYGNGQVYSPNGQVYAPNGQVYAPNGRWGRRQRGDRDCDSDDAYCNGQPNPNYRGNNNGGYYGNNGNSYPNGTYNGNGGYYGNGYGYNNNGAQVAQQNGYNDGLREGSDDRANGHSYRATNDPGYRMATNGYQAQFGSRDQYKQWYRQAYEQGYQQGYNGNGGYSYPPRR